MQGDDPVTVAAIPFAATVGDVAGNLERSLDRLARASDAGARLAVLPELALTGYAPATRDEALELAQPVPAGPAVEAWGRLARERDLVVVAGMCERDGDRCYNTAVAVGPGGVLSRYRKAHLFEREHEVFDQGDTGFPVIDTPFGRLGMLVCYDLRFPDAVRTLALRGAEVVAVPTAWVSLSGRATDLEGRGIQLYVAMAHASMNRLFMVCAGMVGPFRDGWFLGNSVIADVTGWPLEGPTGAQDEGTLRASIRVGEARSKALTPSNDLLRDRRIDLYDLQGTVPR
jgi:N-carbamoylputrescine amidase